MKLEKDQILKLLEKLNLKLKDINEKAEIHILGGAVMCLVFNARASTRDIDAVFRPTKIVRDLSKKIAKEEDLPEGWLNDGVKSFVSERGTFNELLLLSNLSILTATPEYLLAMKCLSMRIGEEFFDLDDVRFLIRYLNIDKLSTVKEILSLYYPLDKYPSKTLLVLEEILSK